MNTHAERTDNPTAEATRLRANPRPTGAGAERAATTRYEVSLTSPGGYFVLNWSATVVGSYDWIGLYVNKDLPDSDYIGGNNWQWAVRGSPYQTGTAAQVGYQVRYLVWDAVAGAYKSVARSEPWAG